MPTTLKDLSRLPEHFPAPAALPALWEAILAPANLRAACRRVVANRGAAGVDRLPVSGLEAHLRRHWPELRAAILGGRYVPQPTRQVNIPKPGGTGVRRLRIPSVVDRFLQTAVVQVLRPRFDAEFSEFSFAYRPGRSAQGAVATAQGYVQEGFTWVVDLDIEQFFDRVNHDTLLAQLGRRLADDRLLQLIQEWLQAGTLGAETEPAAVEGTAQGSPLSPLLANVVLDDFDKELELRGVRFVRYADDCRIFVATPSEARRELERAGTFLTGQLGLPLNQAKTRIMRAHHSAFLGFEFSVDETGRTRRRVAAAAREALAAKLQEVARPQPGAKVEAVVQQTTQVVRGWCRYFAFAEDPESLRWACARRGSTCGNCTGSNGPRRNGARER